MNTNQKNTKTYIFFNDKFKKQKKTTTHTATNHSRSLSAKSDLTKGSARSKIISNNNHQKQISLPLSKK